MALGVFPWDCRQDAQSRSLQDSLLGPKDCWSVYDINLKAPVSHVATLCTSEVNWLMGAWFLTDTQGFFSRLSRGPACLPLLPSVGSQIEGRRIWSSLDDRVAEFMFLYNLLQRPKSLFTGERSCCQFLVGVTGTGSALACCLKLVTVERCMKAECTFRP